MIIAAALAMTGCMQKNCDCEPKFTHQPPVLFQYEYVNYAWGFRHHGFLIDPDGQLRGFRQPAKWISADSTGMLTRADLEYNLSQCDTVCGKVEKGELDRQFRKIEEIRHGYLTDPEMVMADAGTGVFSAWYWNEKIEMYEQVFLVSNGDVYRVNTHPDVKALIEWLKQAGEKTGRFYWFGG